MNTYEVVPLSLDVHLDSIKIDLTKVTKVTKVT